MLERIIEYRLARKYRKASSLTLVHRKIAFRSEVQALLDVLEIILNNLEKSSVEEISNKNTLVNNLDWSHLQVERNKNKKGT